MGVGDVLLPLCCFLFFLFLAKILAIASRAIILQERTEPHKAREGGVRSSVLGRQNGTGTETIRN